MISKKKTVKPKVSKARPIDWNDLISQAEAARLRGVGRKAINQLVKRGRLRTVLVAGKPLVSRKEVQTFKPEAGGRGKRARTVG